MLPDPSSGSERGVESVQKICPRTPLFINPTSWPKRGFFHERMIICRAFITECATNMKVGITSVEGGITSVEGSI